MITRDTMNTNLQKILLTVREAAQALAVSERTLWTLTNSGEVAHVRFGLSMRYDVADLRNWIGRCKSKPAEK
jgi:excisionase family DNA binding protein